MGVFYVWICLHLLLLQQNKYFYNETTFIVYYVMDVKETVDSGAHVRIIMPLIIMLASALRRLRQAPMPCE